MPKAKPAAQKGAKALPPAMKEKLKALPPRAAKPSAPAPGLRPIDVELARRAHFDRLYHTLVKPSPKGKRSGAGQ